MTNFDNLPEEKKVFTNVQLTKHYRPQKRKDDIDEIHAQTCCELISVCLRAYKFFPESSTCIYVCIYIYIYICTHSCTYSTRTGDI